MWIHQRVFVVLLSMLLVLIGVTAIDYGDGGVLGVYSSEDDIEYSPNGPLGTGFYDDDDGGNDNVETAPFGAQLWFTTTRKKPCNCFVQPITTPNPPVTTTTTSKRRMTSEGRRTTLEGLLRPQNDAFFTSSTPLTSSPYDELYKDAKGPKTDRLTQRLQTDRLLSDLRLKKEFNPEIINLGLTLDKTPFAQYTENKQRQREIQIVASPAAPADFVSSRKNIDTRSYQPEPIDNVLSTYLEEPARESVSNSLDYHLFLSPFVIDNPWSSSQRKALRFSLLNATGSDNTGTGTIDMVSIVLHCFYPFISVSSVVLNVCLIFIILRDETLRIGRCNTMLIIVLVGNLLFSTTAPVILIYYFDGWPLRDSSTEADSAMCKAYFFTKQLGRGMLVYGVIGLFINAISRMSSSASGVIIIKSEQRSLTRFLQSLMICSCTLLAALPELLASTRESFGIKGVSICTPEPLKWGDKYRIFRLYYQVFIYYLIPTTIMMVCYGKLTTTSSLARKQPRMQIRGVQRRRQSLVRAENHPKMSPEKSQIARIEEGIQCVTPSVVLRSSLGRNTAMVGSTMSAIVIVCLSLWSACKFATFYHIGDFSTPLYWFQNIASSVDYLPTLATPICVLLMSSELRSYFGRFICCKSSDRRNTNVGGSARVHKQITFLPSGQNSTNAVTVPLEEEVHPKGSSDLDRCRMVICGLDVLMEHAAECTCSKPGDSECTRLYSGQGAGAPLLSTEARSNSSKKNHKSSRRSLRGSKSKEHIPMRVHVQDTSSSISESRYSTSLGRRLSYDMQQTRSPITCSEDGTGSGRVMSSGICSVTVDDGKHTPREREAILLKSLISPNDGDGRETSYESVTSPHNNPQSQSTNSSSHSKADSTTTTGAFSCSSGSFVVAQRSPTRPIVDHTFEDSLHQSLIPIVEEQTTTTTTQEDTSSALDSSSCCERSCTSSGESADATNARNNRAVHLTDCSFKNSTVRPPTVSDRANDALCDKCHLLKPDVSNLVRIPPPPRLSPSITLPEDEEHHEHQRRMTASSYHTDEPIWTAKLPFRDDTGMRQSESVQPMTLSTFDGDRVNILSKTSYIRSHGQGAPTRRRMPPCNSLVDIKQFNRRQNIIVDDVTSQL